MSAATTYVVMIGGLPTATASNLGAAQASALKMEQPYIADGAETRWNEHRPESQWRLMSRAKGERRFSWTQRWIAAVPAADN